MKPHSQFRRLGIVVIATLVGALSGASTVYAQSRGDLLYTTHCVACHTTEIHWRNKRIATDLTGVKFQLRRWQDASGLNWSEDDIEDVARYLNESIYRYPPVTDPVTRLGPSNPEIAAGANSRR